MPYARGRQPARPGPAERIISTPGSPNADAAPTAPGETAPRRARRIGVLLAVALLAYLIDLGSKLLVVAHLEGHDPIRLISDDLMFEATRNGGAAFGMGQAMTVVFTAIAAGVIVVISRMARRLYSLPWAIALGLLLGGALGNLTDRIFRAPHAFEGHVVDFIAVKHFAIFNMADSAIVCGGILVVLLSFLGTNPDGTVHRDSPRGKAAAAAEADAEKTDDPQPKHGDQATAAQRDAR